jgi:hypothetical protein
LAGSGAQHAPPHPSSITFDLPRHRRHQPRHHVTLSRLCSTGGVGLAKEDYVEYDLDNEDEDWLEAYNAGAANRLSEEKFEQMLWRLETSNAEANQRVMNEPGARGAVDLAMRVPRSHGSSACVLFFISNHSRAPGILCGGLPE